jgi:hypothetical protein
MEKNHLTEHVDNKYTYAKSILSTATKQFHQNLKFDFQTYTQVCVVANNTTKNVGYRIHADCHNHYRHHIKLYLNTYTVSLCFDSAFTLIMEQSEFVRLHAERFWNSQSGRAFILASG